MERRAPAGADLRHFNEPGRSPALRLMDGNGPAPANWLFRSARSVIVRARKQNQSGPIHGRTEDVFAFERCLAALFVAVEETDALQLRPRLAAFGHKFANQFGRRQRPATHHVHERKLHRTVVAAIDQFGADEPVRGEEVEIEVVGLAKMAEPARDGFADFLLGDFNTNRFSNIIIFLNL